MWAKSKNFRGTNFIWGAIFSFGKFYLVGFIQFWEILKLCFKGKFGLEGFIQFGQIGVWENLNVYFEGKFFYLRAFSKYMKALFLIKGLSAKCLNFGVITLKFGVFIKHFGIK